MVTLERFSGDNPAAWVLQAEQYFAFYNIYPEYKLSLASVYLDGEALTWYRWLFRNKLLAGWDHFVEKLFLRFGNQTREAPENRELKLNIEIGFEILRQLEDLRDAFSACSKKLAARESSTVDLSLDTENDSSLPVPVSPIGAGLPVEVKVLDESSQRELSSKPSPIAPTESLMAQLGRLDFVNEIDSCLEDDQPEDDSAVDEVVVENSVHEFHTAGESVLDNSEKLFPQVTQALSETTPFSVIDVKQPWEFAGEEDDCLENIADKDSYTVLDMKFLPLLFNETSVRNIFHVTSAPTLIQRPCVGLLAHLLPNVEFDSQMKAAWGITATSGGTNGQVKYLVSAAVRCLSSAPYVHFYRTSTSILRDETTAIMFVSVARLLELLIVCSCNGTLSNMLSITQYERHMKGVLKHILWSQHDFRVHLDKWWDTGQVLEAMFARETDVYSGKFLHSHLCVLGSCSLNYRAVSNWFVRVKMIGDLILRINEQPRDEVAFIGPARAPLLLITLFHIHVRCCFASGQNFKKHYSSSNQDSCSSLRHHMKLIRECIIPSILQAFQNQHVIKTTQFSMPHAFTEAPVNTVQAEMTLRMTLCVMQSFLVYRDAANFNGSRERRFIKKIICMATTLVLQVPFVQGQSLGLLYTYDPSLWHAYLILNLSCMNSFERQGLDIVNRHLLSRDSEHHSFSHLSLLHWFDGFSGFIWLIVQRDVEEKITAVAVTFRHYPSMSYSLAVKLWKLGLLPSCSILIHHVNEVVSVTGSSRMSREKSFGDHFVHLLACTWWPPWKLETSLAFYAIYKAHLFWTFADHLLPKLKMNYCLVSYLYILERIVVSDKVSPIWFMELPTRSILVLFVVGFVYKLGLSLELGSYTVAMRNLSMDVGQSTIAQPASGMKKLLLCKFGLLLKVGWWIELYLVHVMLDTYLSLNIFIYPNLEDKVLIEGGSIVMNGPGGVSANGPVCRSIRQKQPKASLSGWVWDPGG